MTERNGWMSFVVVVLAGMTFWHYGYTRPHEEFLLRVSQCTQGNTSQGVWKSCVKQVQNS